MVDYLVLKISKIQENIYVFFFFFIYKTYKCIFYVICINNVLNIVYTGFLLDPQEVYVDFNF